MFEVTIVRYEPWPNADFLQPPTTSCTECLPIDCGDILNSSRCNMLHCIALLWFDALVQELDSLQTSLLAMASSEWSVTCLFLTGCPLTGGPNTISSQCHRRDDDLMNSFQGGLVGKSGTYWHANSILESRSWRWFPEKSQKSQIYGLKDGLDTDDHENSWNFVEGVEFAEIFDLQNSLISKTSSLFGFLSAADFLLWKKTTVSAFEAEA